MSRGWRSAVLGDVCEMIKRGVAPKYVDSGGVCVINQKCIRNHGINLRLSRRHDISAKKIQSERYIQPGDVLVNSTGTGTLGRVAQVRAEAKEPTTVDTHVTIVRPIEGMFHPEFFGYMLVQIEDEIASSGEGTSGQTELSRKKLEQSFTVSFPESLEEQKRIVAILDEAFAGIERAVANTEKNLANVDELFDGTVEKLFSSDRYHWKLKRIPEICIDFGRGKSRHRPRNEPSLYGGNYPFIQTGDLNEADHIVDKFKQTYNEKGLAQSKLWPRGTVGIAIVGATIGETAVLGFDACFPDSIIGILPDPKEGNSFFVEYLLQFFKEKIKSQGAGSARHNINLGTFDKIVFPIPPIKEQEEIVNVIDEVAINRERLVSIYQRKLAALSELKQSLLQKAFSGELTADPDRALKEVAA